MPLVFRILCVKFPSNWITGRHVFTSRRDGSGFTLQNYHRGHLHQKVHARNMVTVACQNFLSWTQWQSLYLPLNKNLLNWPNLTAFVYTNPTGDHYQSPAGVTFSFRNTQFLPGSWFRNLLYIILILLHLWHNGAYFRPECFASMVIIKRHHNIIRIAGIINRSIKVINATKILTWKMSFCNLVYLFYSQRYKI